MRQVLSGRHCFEVKCCLSSGRRGPCEGNHRRVFSTEERYLFAFWLRLLRRYAESGWSVCQLHHISQVTLSSLHRPPVIMFTKAKSSPSFSVYFFMAHTNINNTLEPILLTNVSIFSIFVKYGTYWNLTELYFIK